MKIGGALLSGMRDVAPADALSLDVVEVDAAFDRIAALSGAGSAATRAQLLRELFVRATRDEQDFLMRLLFGELRQGALEGDPDGRGGARVRHPGGPDPPRGDARRRSGARSRGRRSSTATRRCRSSSCNRSSRCSRCSPIRRRTSATRSPTLGEASFEYKLDGARIQVHKVGDEVKVYSRNLRDVTIAVPEVVTVARAMPAREIVLDGEAIALRPDGTPASVPGHDAPLRPQARRREPAGTSCRSRRCSSTRSISTATRSSTSRSPGASALLGEQVAPANLVPRLVTASADAAAAFAARALAAGHEGVMAKAVDGLYAAGRRGQAWLKVKQARTLDLVVLAAEWGSGRRRGMLSNLHLGARDSERGGFVMLGKTFKGLTDEMLAWQTKTFLELEIGRDDYTVYVRPEVVVEIAFNDVQASPQYPGGFALRFARVKRYRTDKTRGRGRHLRDDPGDLPARRPGSDPPVSEFRCRSSGVGVPPGGAARLTTASVPVIALRR